MPIITFEGWVGRNGVYFQASLPRSGGIWHSVNKSQGQTLYAIGLDARDDPFVYGN